MNENELDKGSIDDPRQTDPRCGNPGMVWKVRIYNPQKLREEYRMGRLEAVEGAVLREHPMIEDEGWSYEIMPVGVAPLRCAVSSEGMVIAVG